MRCPTSTSNPTSPNQINCGANCSASYDYGTIVTITAQPTTGSTFFAWTGCDSTVGNTCTVTMNSAKSVTAVFNLQIFTLTASKTGMGNGTVTSTSTPSGSDQINCGSKCSASYSYGTAVRLSPNPDLLSGFSGWTGCDSVSGTTCIVTITAQRRVTANYRLLGLL